MQILTTEQVLALAPDAASVRAGQGLANPGKWVSVGRGERAVWGECQGSGKVPYRTQADMTGPAFHCSCPSRKFPCKHGLGLLLLLAGNATRVPEAAPPPWVVEWLGKRDASAEKKTAKAEAASAPVAPETAAEREAERVKRAARREDRVRVGLEELQVWLGDLTRQGLAQAKQQPAQYFDAMAARLVDSQAPRLARRLREWPGVFASGDGWADRALAETGSMQWLLHGFARLETLPEGLRASVRQAIGWTVAEAELNSVEAVHDRWQIVGQVVEEDDKLRVQRTWLVGTQTRRPALSLSFAAMNQPLDVSLIAGTVIQAGVAFHPGGAPLRGVVCERQGEAHPLVAPVAQASFAEALGETADLLAGDPWLECTPWWVRECLPLRSDDTWWLRDAQGAVVPLSRRCCNPWTLLAVSGGRPFTLFGEWDGTSLLPLSVVVEGRFISLGGALG